MSYLKSLFEILGHMFGDLKFKRRKTYPMDDQCKLLAVVDVGRNLRVDFLKLAPSCDFETRSRAVIKL